MNRKKKDVLFLCQFFYPESISSAVLPFDTAKYLASNGFSVEALVGFPKEYSNTKNLPKQDFANNVRIKRIRYLQFKRVGKIGRLINYFSFTFNIWLRTSYFKDYKVVVVYSNPPILPFVPIIAKKKYGIKIVYVVYDVYPEVAYASKSIERGSVISKTMNRINRELYQLVDCVVALTDEMKNFLLHNRPELAPNRILTIANWAHEKIVGFDDGAYERYGYCNGQFVVSYFGNMGTCQDVCTMLEAARLLKDDERIRFLIIGHGNKKEEVALYIKNNKLKNVQLLDFVTGTEFEQAVSVSSCCILSLERGLKGTCAPSKYYSYLQGGKPILAVVEKDSYIAQEVESNEIGYTIEIGDSVGLRNTIISMVENKKHLIEMGQRARALYEARYTYDIAMSKYAGLIGQLVRDEQ